MTTGSSIIGMVLSFGASVFLARVLGAELRGVYALSVLVPTTIYALTTFGLSTAHIVYAGKYPEKRGVIAFQSFAFATIIGLLTLGFYAYLLTYKPTWFQRFLVVGKFNLLLASFLVSLQLAWIYLRSGILGANRIPIISVSTITFPIIQILLILIFVFLLRLGVTGGIIAQLGSFSFLILFMVVATATKTPISMWRPDFTFFKKSITLGAKLHLNHIAWFIVHTIDRYMIVYLLPNSDKALGHYAVASQFSLILWVLPQSLQATFLPHLSVTKSDKSTLTVKTVRVLLLALLPIFLVLTAGAPLIRVILGRDYAESVIPFMLFLPGMFFFGCTRPLDSYLTHIEKPMYAAVNSWMGAGVNVILNVHFIPKMGICGAAFASSTSAVLMALVTVFCFRYETKLPLREFVLQSSDFALFFGMVSSSFKKIQSIKGLKIFQL